MPIRLDLPYGKVEAVKKVVDKPSRPAPTPKWMSAFGGLRDLHNETVRINRILEQEFEQIEEDEWQA
jgi:hypothetical protein